MFKIAAGIYRGWSFTGAMFVKFVVVKQDTNQKMELLERWVVLENA